MSMDGVGLVSITTKSGAKAEVSRFGPGNNANPHGRPKGSRNKLGEDFIRDLHTRWQEKGIAVIDKVIETKPEVFLKVIAQVIPQQLHVEVEEKVDETQLAAVISAVQAEVDRRAKERKAAIDRAEAQAKDVLQVTYKDVTPS